LDKSKNRKFLDFKEKNFFALNELKNFETDQFFMPWKYRKQLNFTNYDVYSFIPSKLLN